MRILIFGAKGYIGSEFVNQFQFIPDAEIFCVPSRLADGSSYLYRELSGIIVQVNPDVVINCAAYVGGLSIINCETRKDLTIQSNIIFPQMLGEICSGADIVFGHLSSGCIYNGYPEGGFKEDDEPNLTFKTKCSFYTGTKALAEELLAHVPNKYIWRIRLPFDEFNHPRNYLTKMMQFDKLVEADNSISNRKELVKACIECILKAVPFGTYNVTNPGSIRASEIVAMTRKILKTDKEFQYFADSAEFDKFRQIPTSNVILSSSKLTEAGIFMAPVHDSIEWSLRNWR